MHTQCLTVNEAKALMQRYHPVIDPHAWQQHGNLGRLLELLESGLESPCPRSPTPAPTDVDVEKLVERRPARASLSDAASLTETGQQVTGEVHPLQLPAHMSLLSMPEQASAFSFPPMFEPL